MFKDELQVVFRDVFDDDTIEITTETNAKDLEDWDSLMHINLVVEIEKRFSVKLTTSEVSGMQKVGDMLDILEQRGTL